MYASDSKLMHEQRPSNPRKRTSLEQPLHLTEASEVPPKRRKILHPSGSRPPAEFWNNLTKIWLTRRALEELDGRNTGKQDGRRVTRRSVAEWEKDQAPARSAESVLVDLTPKGLKDLKAVARHGGADLSDLKGVCITQELTSNSADHNVV